MRSFREPNTCYFARARVANYCVVYYTFSLLNCYVKPNKNGILGENDGHNALIMCLIIEALQSYFLVMDDIMDQSLTRRGVPCWYKHQNVGLKAVNDGSVIESLIFWLIHHRLVADECI
eukprot:314667_1